MSLNNDKILYLSFNFDNSLFGVGTEIGFKIFTTESLQLKLKRNLGGGIGLIQILGKSNIFCLCGGGKNPKYSPNKLIIYDDKKAKEIKEFRFNSNIQNSKIKQEKIFIISQNEISIIDIKTFPYEIIETIKTCENIYGACSIAKDPENYLFAWPDTNIGYIELKIFSNENELIEENDIKKYHHIKAHENTIEIIEINFNGTKFSSASDKGTIIRVFNIQDDTLLHEFRRGTEQAIIYNISFDLNDTLLVVSSNRSTVHLFAIIDKNDPNKGNKELKNKKSMFKGISKMLGVGKILQSEWSFAKITVQSNCKSIIACFSDQNKIVIINYLGNFIEAIYGVKPDSSIECKIMKNESIFEKE